jgi:hypothetical protein
MAFISSSGLISAITIPYPLLWLCDLRRIPEFLYNVMHPYKVMARPKGAAGNLMT